ncbi:MAG: efflux RND transporter periplasmic adaptor subunit [Myxococcota bacterium]|jgi:RND family efflux transporter MFP subunit|nr:efflux RND transporter periplasmic adaptor subunit [Myxococcota bacterium]
MDHSHRPSTACPIAPQRFASRSLLVFVLLLASAIALSACQKGGTPALAADSEEKTKRKVLLENLERGEIIDALTVTATLKPNAQVAVLSLMTDRIIELNFEDGDEVVEGQVLARVRKDAMSKNQDQLKAQVEALDTQISAYSRELDRSRKLLEGHVVSQQSIDQLQTSYDAAVAQRRGLLAQRSQLQINLDNATVRAAMSGTIVNKRVELGDLATPSVPMATIMSLDPIKVEVKVPEERIGELRIGQEIRLRLDALPGEQVVGTIDRILPYINVDSHTNTVEILLPNPVDPQSGQRKLKPGMFAWATIIFGVRPNALLVPQQALLLDEELFANAKPGDNPRYAFVVDAQKRAHRRLVQIGVDLDDRYEVLSGLDETDQVIVRGHHGLEDGAEVVLSKDQSEASPPATTAGQDSKGSGPRDANPSPPSQEAGTTGQAPNGQEAGGTGQAPHRQEVGGTGQVPNRQKTPAADTAIPAVPSAAEATPPSN